MAVPDLQDAISHLQQKNPDAAITALEEKIEELPAHLTAHVLLARAYEAKQRWADALMSWQNVRFLMPNSPVAREGKERTLRHLRQSDASGSSSPSTPADTAPASGDAADTATPPPPADADDAPDRTEDASADEDPTDTADAEPTPTESAPKAAPDSTEESPPSTDTPEATDASDDSSDPTPPQGEGPTTASEAVSELEQLRRQAEEEARQGGARADRPEETPDAESTPNAPTPPDTPEERIREMNEDDDLERLIDELESARIEPNPEVEDVPTPDLDDNVDDIVSETLARIHEAQDQYRKAAQIYVKLASQEPDQARTYLQKASEMRERAEAQNDTEDAES
jgi:tetratricopeptide (TPR) repeat protein